MDPRIDKMIKQLERLYADAMSVGDKAQTDTLRKTWYGKAIAYQISLSIIRNRLDPNWID